MNDRHADDWEDLARREPYFAVLTNEGLPGVVASSIATTAFLETGEEDIATLLSAISSVLGHDMAMRSALDFGCGAGRLTLPLARRATRVVACDIAPTMLAHARQNAAVAGLHNVTFVDADELQKGGAGPFDFVCSLLVFQYIRPAVGYALIRTLLSLVAPDGIAALHITIAGPRRRLQRLDRWIRERSRPGQNLAGVAGRGNALRPCTQIFEYDERTADRYIEAAGAEAIGRFPTHTGDIPGAVLILRCANQSVARWK